MTKWHTRIGRALAQRAKSPSLCCHSRAMNHDHRFNAGNWSGFLEKEIPPGLLKAQVELALMTCPVRLCANVSFTASMAKLIKWSEHRTFLHFNVWKGTCYESCRIWVHEMPRSPQVYASTSSFLWIKALVTCVYLWFRVSRCIHGVPRIEQFQNTVWSTTSGLCYQAYIFIDYYYYYY